MISDEQKERAAPPHVQAALLVMELEGVRDKLRRDPSYHGHHEELRRLVPLVVAELEYLSKIEALARRLMDEPVILALQRLLDAVAERRASE